MKGGKGKAASKKETPEVLKPTDDRFGLVLIIGDPISIQCIEKPSHIIWKVILRRVQEIYKKEHPNVKAVSAVGKAGGEKWKSMSHAEKAPYEAKAAKRKSDYEKQMSAYNKKQESNADDGEEESDRSKSEVNDEDEEESGEEEEGDDEDDE
ncbi:hypothetical protein HPP92_015306 [Vanilla planifolia]|uniref:HMG box domain-containing protein n=1 Tax=Vanilla planifolia TaxID=51239 RepID=A0A835QIX6_VANPL|nr:hypothetical protein HPP92_015306 [Vanilla planifolia]